MARGYHRAIVEDPKNPGRMNLLRFFDHEDMEYPPEFSEKASRRSLSTAAFGRGKRIRKVIDIGEE